MSEMRFNQPELKEEKKDDEVVEKQKSSGSKILAFFRVVFKLLGIVIILVAIVYMAFFTKDYFGSSRGDKGEYSAVFLTNGQVYFGKMVRNDGSEIVLNNVYYLQANTGGASEQGTTALGQNTFNLVKLGNELHGPTDELFVNKAQVMFFEYLRDDSKVVESIQKQ